MTAGADRPTYAGPDEADADRLRAARATLADIAQHTTRDVQAACQVVLSLSEDAEEREEAEGLLKFFSRRQRGDPCARS